MRSAFRPAALRSLTKQYLPWWCHVWDQPSDLQPTGPSLHSIYLGGVMYEISLQPCSPQVPHYTVFTLVVSCMRSAFSLAAHRSLTTQYLPWWCHVWDQTSALQPTGLSLHSPVVSILGGVMYEISLQTCSPQVPHYTVFTLVVSCMRSAFRPAAHRSLTTQYLPWWCHVWDQPSDLQPTGPSLHSIYHGGVMYEISLQTCSPQVPHYTVFTLVVSCMRSAFSPAAHRSLTTQYLPWWCQVWDQPLSLQPTGLSLHSIYLGGVMYEISLQTCSPQVSHYTVFTLVVSCMRSDFSPAAHRSLTTQPCSINPYWCHVWDQPSALQPTGPLLHSIYLGGVMYEISLQTCSPQVPHYTVFTLVVSCMRLAFRTCSPQISHYTVFTLVVSCGISLQTCSPQVPHYTVFTLVVSCMRSAFRPAAQRSLTTQYLPWWCHVWDQPSVLQPTGPSLHSFYLGGVMYEISLQTCSPQVPHYTVFTLVVSCMRSAFRPAAHRSLTTQYLPWWCHVWDQPSDLQPTGLSLHSIYLGGVMYEISLQPCSPQVSHYTVFTLVVSCMRSAFRPAAHRSLTT